MAQVTIRPPEGVSADEARLYLAIKLFEERRLSLGKAAEYAGYSAGAFMEILGKHRVPIVNHEPDELKQDAGGI